MSIHDRKKDHIRLSLLQDVQYRQSNGLDRYIFEHNALPEVNADDVTTEATLFGRTFSYPLFVSSMTGGYDGASSINAQIARFCQQRNLPFGVGSQRALLEAGAVVGAKTGTGAESRAKTGAESRAEAETRTSSVSEQTRRSYSIVREMAPDAFIASNIGGVQLIHADISTLVDVIVRSIDADAVIVHLNPLQELMQPEGDRSFTGVLLGIEALCEASTVPVIVKETGAGISGRVAKRLLEAGVQAIDVAGAGGTSWAKIENHRHPDAGDQEPFADWGIDTATCLTDMQPLRASHSFELIASGGIGNPFDLLKALCLGANFAASAGTILKTLMSEGEAGLHKMLDLWEKQTRIALTLLGCERVSECAMHHLRLNPSYNPSKQDQYAVKDHSAKQDHPAGQDHPFVQKHPPKKQ